MRLSLPKGWKLAKLGEVGEVITGSTPSTARPEYYGNEVPFVTPVDLDRHDPVNGTKSYLSRLGAAQARLLPAESVMVCCIGSLGKVGIAGTQVATNQQINSLIFDQSKIFPRYGYYYCKTLKPVMEHMAPSTTVAIINKSRFSEISIPFPPLPEQRRIAAILDKADAIRRKRQRAIELTEDFLRSVFLEMFGDPMTNPKGWRKFTIEELLSNGMLIVHKDGNFGSNYPRSEDFGENGISFLTAKCVNEDGTINKNEIQKLREEKASTYKFGWIEKGDILLSHNATVGRVAFYNCDYQKALIGTSLTCYRTNDEHIIPEFLFSMLRSSFFQKQLSKLMAQTTRNQVPITAQRLISIVVPPIEYQRQLANIFRKNIKLSGRYQKALNTR